MIPQPLADQIVKVAQERLRAWGQSLDDSMIEGTSPQLCDHIRSSLILDEMDYANHKLLRFLVNRRKRGGRL